MADTSPFKRLRLPEGVAELTIESRSHHESGLRWHGSDNSGRQQDGGGNSAEVAAEVKALAASAFVPDLRWCWWAQSASEVYVRGK